MKALESGVGYPKVNVNVNVNIRKVLLLKQKSIGESKIGRNGELLRMSKIENE